MSPVIAAQVTKKSDSLFNDVYFAMLLQLKSRNIDSGQSGRALDQ